MSFLGSIAEAIFGALFKSLFGWFLPSKDEQLGTAKANLKTANEELKNVEEREKVDQNVNSLTDDNVSRELLDHWTRK